MSADVRIESNRGEILAALRKATLGALTLVGQEWADEAGEIAGNSPHWPTDIGEDVNYAIYIDEKTGDTVLEVGSNQELAAYKELGTGKYYEPPEEYLKSLIPKGVKIPAGLDYWLYQDDDKKWHVGTPQHPDPFIQPAWEKNKDRWAGIIEQELQEAKEGTGDGE